MGIWAVLDKDTHYVVGCIEYDGSFYDIISADFDSRNNYLKDVTGLAIGPDWVYDPLNDTWEKSPEFQAQENFLLNKLAEAQAEAAAAAQAEADAQAAAQQQNNTP